MARELGDEQLPSAKERASGSGLFTGYGGRQNILEREGADPSDLQAARAASDMPSGQDMVDEATPENVSELIDLLKALGVIAPEFDPNSLGGAGQTPSLEEMYARLLDMYNNAVGVQYGDPGGAGTGSDDSGTGTGPLTDDDGNLLVDGDGNLIFGPIIPGVTVPNFPLPPNNQNNDGDDDAGGGGGSGGEEGGEAGASDDGGGDAGGSDSGGDSGGEGGEGGEGEQQFYEVDEDGNVFVVDYEDEDGFFDENGFWQGDFKKIGNLDDDVDAWWKEIFQPGGSYAEHGEPITSPEDDDDGDDDDDDGFQDPNTGEPQTGGPQPPGGDGDGGDGATDDGTDTGGGGDDTGGGGGGSDDGGGGGDGGGDGTGGDDGSGGDGSDGEGDGGDGSGDGSGGDGIGDGLGGDDLEFDPDKLSVNLPFIVPDLYDVPQQRGMFLSQIAQPNSSLMLDDFFVRQMNRKGGMLV